MRGDDKIVVNSLINLSLFILIASQVIIPFRALSLWAYLWLVPMLLWFFWVTTSHFYFLKELPLQGKLMLFFSIYTISFAYLFDNESIGNRYLSLSVIPFFYYSYEFIKSVKSQAYIMRVVVISMLPISISAVVTLRALMDSPYISRIIRSGDEFSNGFLLQGIGGYDLIYFLSFVGIMLFCLIVGLPRQTIKPRVKFFLFIGLILAVATVIFSNYFTALSVLLSSMFVFLTLRRLTKYNFVFIAVLIGSLFIVINVYIIEIFDFLLEILPSGKTAERVQLLKSGILYSSEVSLYDGRETTITSSIDGFLRNPFWGLITNEIKITDNFFSGFGQHSQIFDTYSLYGFVLGSTQVAFITLVFLRNWRSEFKFLNAFTGTMLFATLLLNTLNNSTPLVGYAYFFIYPAVYDYFIQKLQGK